jgi:hypothetical protein
VVRINELNCNRRQGCTDGLPLEGGGAIIQCFFFKSSVFSSSQTSYIYLSSKILIFAQIIGLFLSEFIRLSDLLSL